jgi:excisionase family DNA binding protein
MSSSPSPDPITPPVTDPPAEQPKRRKLARAPLHDRLAYRIPEVAALIGIGESTAYELAANGSLPTVLVGKMRLVPADALRRLLEAK